MSSATILLVEDDPALGDSIKVILEASMPVQVILVTSLEEAEGVLSRSTEYFFAALFDRNVIGGTTDELVRKFQMAEPRTATFNISDDTEARNKLGCRFNFPKPFKVRNIITVLEDLLKSS